MRGIQWIFDTTPSAEARSRALRHANFLIGIMKKTNGKVMQQIWTDGTYFYHYKTSPFINQIRVWGAERGKLRFWILADDVFYVMYLDKQDVWQISAVDEEYRLPHQGNYQWNNLDGSIVINSLMYEEVSQSCFNWQWDNFVPAYARFGGMCRVAWRTGAIDPFTYGPKTQPLLTDAIASVNRETRTTPTHGMPWLYDTADAPYPYPSINVAAPERSTHRMPSIATNPNDYWNNQLDAGQASAVINGRVSADDIVSLGLYEGAFKHLLALKFEVPETALFTDLDKSAPGFYGDPATQVFYPMGKDYVGFAGGAINIGGGYVYLKNFVAASPDGLQTVLTVRGSDSAGNEFRTGRYYNVTVDHAAQTAFAEEKKHEYTQDVTDTQLVTINDGAGGNFNGSKTVETIEHLYGYGYDELGVLEEVELRITTEDTQTVITTFTEIYSPDPPNVPAQAGDYYETISTWDATRDISYLVEVLVDSVVLFTKTLTPTAIVEDRSTTTRVTSDGLGGTTETVIETDTETRTEVDGYNIILHSLETLTDSLSITILEGVDVYNTLVTAFDRTVTDTETTMIRGNLVDTKIYTATSLAVAGTGVITVGVGYSFWTTGTIVSQTLFAPTSSGNNFPNSTINVKNYSTGTRRRFLKDFVGNVLTYCPTGQEAYWNTSSNGPLVAHSETTPPIKWRLDLLPSVFGLYGSDGIAIDLSHLTLTNIEAIGVIDTFNTWSE